MILTYFVDGERVSVQGPEPEDFFFGEDLILSQNFSDVASTATWYHEGYKVVRYARDAEFEQLKVAIENLIMRKILSVFPEKDLRGFRLEKYHEFVSQSEHVERMDRLVKRFFWDDINFEDKPLIEKIEREIARRLDYTPVGSCEPHWIIIRINMPGSLAYNPAHKDIYEGFDKDGVCPSMINAWVPVCGVSEQAGLAIVPNSHLIPESEIHRTKPGSQMNGNNYFVNCIKSWSGSADLRTIFPDQGEMLIFSSHLIHGLGRNKSPDTTRVALEFRLHGQESK